MPKAPCDLESTQDLGARVESAPFDTLLLPTTLNGRYEVTELLGEGGMGVVYRATDLVSGRELALKTLRRQRVSPASLALFEAEFMTLAALSHPNVAAVYDFGRRQGSAECFFTMELVAGQNAFMATRGASFERIWGLISQVLRALSYLHARRVIHFDVKPANILVTSDGHVRLLDFGIARSTYSSEHGLYTTPVYTAPEVRNEGAVVDRRADLYSLGVTWFQLLFGRLPPPPAALDDPREGAVLELSGAERARVPPWMPTILQRLLESDPARRYRTANEVIAAMNRARGANEAMETDETSDSYVASAPLVGREPALAALLGHVQRRARLGQPGCLAALCVGPSGSGKSRLLRELRHRCQLARYFVLEGNCYAEASEPYGAWSEVVAQAASALGAASAHLAVVEQLAWPVAARLGATAKPRAMSADELADGVVQLLLTLGSPCVVILADLQWMDAMSLELLELVLERCAAFERERPTYLAFFLSSREECSSSLRATLERLRNARALLDVPLPPLEANQVGELVEAMLGTNDIAPTLVQTLTDATRGSALLVAELLRAWVKDGRLAPQASGWTFRVAPCSPEIVLEVARLFRDRLRELAPVQLQALHALAISGRPLALGLLAAVLEADSDSTLEAVTELRRRSLVFLSRDGLVHISMECWSDASSAVIEPEQRTTLHLRLGQVLAASGDAALAAFHYQRGANLAAAAEQYGRAAARCYARGALTQVLEHVESSVACGASGVELGRLCSVAAEAARRCGDPRAASFAERALRLLPTSSSDWMQASRVAVAMFNPLAKGS